ncbi:MAG: DUF4031 domain-containing protein [Pirellulales bacterium]
MGVYVDDYEGRFGRMVMCHMMADTLAELHEFAQRLGLRRDWFQNGSAPHYDLSKEKRAEALALGAIEVPIRIDGVRNPEWLRVYSVAKAQRTPNK